ncbi:MAG: YIP1 family protein [Acidimicrobiia bacterium]
MNENVRHAFRLASFDRQAARRISFDSSATADAVVLVAAIEAVLVGVFLAATRRFDLIGLLEAVILGIAGWLILAAAIWLMGTKVLKGSGAIDAMIRVSGFARLPLLLGIADFLTARAIFGLIGLLWHLALLVVAAGVVLGLQLKEAVAAVALGAALVAVVQLVFGAALFRF